jgi:hypothetical protein
LPRNHVDGLAIIDGAARHPMKCLLLADKARKYSNDIQSNAQYSQIKMVIALVGLITILAFRG